MESIESRVGEIEKNLLELERFDIEYGREYVSALENAVLLLRESENGPAYVQERAKRLHSLLFHARDRMEYRSAFYNPLHRQITKIKDTDISDYFSPALRKRLDGLNPCLEKKGNLILYRLGRTRYAVFGELKERRDAVSYKELKKMSFSGSEPYIFPPESKSFQSDIFNAKNFMIVNHKVNGVYALYYDEILDIREMDREHIEKNIYPLRRPHPNVPGRVKIQGTSYCLLRPWMGSSQPYM